MAARRPPKKSLVLWLGVPMALSAGAFAYVADNPLAAGGVGAVVGLVIGIALLAFPNLDRGGPDDSEGGIFH
ncbi:MAG: hypothetical protein SGI91_14290 [Alphaproteobacteria bacterium]|jgi:hypothetical protein|nr:hypothetical protein [Alphaproteobacteria bacterium]